MDVNDVVLEIVNVSIACGTVAIAVMTLQVMVIAFRAVRQSLN